MIILNVSIADKEEIQKLPNNFKTGLFMCHGITRGQVQSTLTNFTVVDDICQN